MTRTNYGKQDCRKDSQIYLGETMSVNIVERLRRLDTSAVSDALDRLELPGAVSSLRALSQPQRIAGVAITVQLDRADGKAAPRHLCTAAVDACGPDTVIVIAHNGRTDVAGWGGILSLGAVARKVEGVVIDGACRDLDESRELGLPLYGRAAVPVTARGRIVETGWNEPVKIDGCVVCPGDLVIADASGVVFVPKARAADVIEIAEQVAAREKAMTEAVRAGKPLVEVMGMKYEAMLQPKEAL
jgi:regulator of RNase E activity RraA